MPKLRTTSTSIQANLTQVTTRDGISLSGIVIKPRGKKRAALIWVHGLTSSFDSGFVLMDRLSRACLKQGIGYFKFNTRGHHVISTGPRRPIGAAYEHFPDCVKDIAAVIALARRLGYRRIFLAGHSTGANKIVYYAYRRPRGVHGLLLAGAISDIAGTVPQVGQPQLDRRLRLARRLMKRNPRQLMPIIDDHVYSAARFISLYAPAKAEDVFQYYRSGSWTALRSIQCPIHMMIGGADQHLDRSVAEYLRSFSGQVKTKHYTQTVIPGASHGFQGSEAAVVRATMRWIESLIKRQR